FASSAFCDLRRRKPQSQVRAQPVVARAYIWRPISNGGRANWLRLRRERVAHAISRLQRVSSGISVDRVDTTPWCAHRFSHAAMAIRDADIFRPFSIGRVAASLLAARNNTHKLSRVPPGLRIVSPAKPRRALLRGPFPHAFAVRPLRAREF